MKPVAAVTLALLLATTSLGAAKAPPAYDLVIRGGEILDGSGKVGVQGDVAIKDDRIAYVGPHAPGRGAQEIDAKGKLVLPGGVDPHVHLIIEPGRSGGPGYEHDGADDYTSGSASALAGGTTTLGNMIIPNPKEELPAAFERAAAVARPVAGRQPRSRRSASCRGRRC